ncbi:MAG: acyl-CoA dehydrogenase family protein [Chloroflexi bacterium]|nr:acyl-CoA dehydrogenase family protein [Chloroflexota bacterium]
MIESLLSDEQKLFRTTVRSFGEKEVTPHVAEWDEASEFPWQELILKKMGSLGFLGLMVPQEYGGYGGGAVDLVILMEEMCRAGFMPAITSISGACRNIAHFGREEQRQKYLPDLAAGKILGASAQTEPDAGSDSSGMKTTAQLVGDQYVINGTKIFISNAPIADVFIVAAKDISKQPARLSAFIVERGTPGLVIGKKETEMGLRLMPQAPLYLDNCSVPRENLLDLGPNGIRSLMQEFNTERCGNSGACLGWAQAAFERALDYAQERQTFGKPLAGNQGIQWMLADMATTLEAGRLLVYNAAYRLDKGLRAVKEVAMAKCFMNEQAFKIINDAMQIHGGYGYSREYAVERMLRDQRGLGFGGGTPQMLRTRIASELLRDSQRQR